MQKFARAFGFIARHHPSRVTLGLAGATALFAMVAQAAEFHAPGSKTAAAHPAPAPVYAMVWSGSDVDGDGRADFANPTGLEIRAHDDFGYGYFGASRDGGARHHEGVDYSGVAGQDIAAPVSGQVTRMGYAYADGEYKYVEITNETTGYVARVFYIDSSVAIGETVALGQKIGTLKSLQTRYPGITDHVHLEVMQHGHRLDAGQVITARWAKTLTRAS